ncbi:MAG: nucleotidyltransferase domain-containing protein [Firmicutes bacterium]|nr:nucleotidyltransferase domain-containing protein [Bacillota bacterium]
MRKLTQKFVEILQENPVPTFVDSLILFGSEVYGNPTKNSDIDIAVVSKKNLTISQRCDMDEFIESCNPPYDCQLTYVDFSATDSVFDVKRDIFSKGIEIYVKPG